MAKKKVVSKGYTFEVTSWENDGDNYQTHSATFKTKKELSLVKTMCEDLFTSSSNGGKGIGNLDLEEFKSAVTTIIDYFLVHPGLLELHKLDYPTESDIREAYKDCVDYTGDNWNEFSFAYVESNAKMASSWHDMAMNYNYQLLGYSDCYYSRIAESNTSHYSDKNVYLEEV
jgi:hypothetical protein